MEGEGLPLTHTHTAEACQAGCCLTWRGGVAVVEQVSVGLGDEQVQVVNRLPGQRELDGAGRRG